MLTHLRRLPWGIFLAGVILRLIPVILSRGLGIGLDDMFQYDMLARSLLAGNGYRWYAAPDLSLAETYLDFDIEGVDYDPRGVRTSHRAPLYPAFLALVYFVSGSGDGRFFAARLAQAFLGGGLALLTWALARRLFPDRERAARLSAWAAALYPMLALFPLALATENLFLPLLLASLLALLRAEASRRWTDFALAGLLLGLLALTRSVVMGFAGLALAWLWFGAQARRGAFIVLTVLLVVTVPWAARNSSLHGRFVGIESSMGYNLYLGYHPQGAGTFHYGISLDLIPMLDDGQRDLLGRQKALEFVRADPGHVPYLMVRKLGYFFGLERRALEYFYSNNFFGYLPRPVLLTLAFVFLSPFVLVSISAAFGLALARWDRRLVLVALLVTGYIFPHLLILAEERFHMALVPVLAIFAARFWDDGWQSLRRRAASPGGRLALLLALLAVLLLCLNWGLELARDADKLARLFGPLGNQSYFPY